MKNVTFPHSTPFDAITGELLPAYRDYYLKGQLSPVPAQQVEAYVKSSAVQTGVLLGRYHELAAQARQTGTTLAPPPRWVQQQLLFQPSVSRVGPLRRPVVRLALALFGALIVASGLQWMRNKPLLPAPVVAAVSRAAATATQATQRLVQRFTASPVPAVAALRPVAKRPVSVRPAAQAVAALPARTTVLPVPSPADSLVVTPPPVVAPKPVNPGAAATTVVQGRISDEQGRPLPGATVLVVGTQLATSTNALGEYTLEVPANATLQFGYGGYTDQLLRNPGGGTLNVTLQAEAMADKRRDRRHLKL